MNRFHSHRTKSRNKIIFWLPIVAFVVLVFFFLKGIQTVSDTTLQKQEESLKVALDRSVAQCYAVEGFYPPSVTYLTEHYGLTYDPAVFFVDYEYYGGNLLPEITVLRRHSNS